MKDIPAISRWRNRLGMLSTPCRVWLGHYFLVCLPLVLPQLADFAVHLDLQLAVVPVPYNRTHNRLIAVHLDSFFCPNALTPLGLADRTVDRQLFGDASHPAFSVSIPKSEEGAYNTLLFVHTHQFLHDTHVVPLLHVRWHYGHARSF